MCQRMNCHFNRETTMYQPIEYAPYFTPVTVRGEEGQESEAVYLNDDRPGWYVPGKIYERLEWEPVEWRPATSGEACPDCDGIGTARLHEVGFEEACDTCDGEGTINHEAIQ